MHYHSSRMKNTKPTVKVLHSETSSSYKSLHLSIKTIREKINKGAKLTHFLPNQNGRGEFVTLKEINKKGQQKCWYLNPTPELLRLDHDFVKGI
jgi:hypothetical protein